MKIMKKKGKASGWLPIRDPMSISSACMTQSSRLSRGDSRFLLLSSAERARGLRGRSEPVGEACVECAARGADGGGEGGAGGPVARTVARELSYWNLTIYLVTKVHRSNLSESGLV